jgi:hypothetical protein
VDRRQEGASPHYLVFEQPDRAELSGNQAALLPEVGFKNFESASRFCTTFDELRNYLRIRPDGEAGQSPTVRRAHFLARWNALMTDFAA